MTEAFAVETTIDHPVDVVWARLVDWDAAARWMPGVDAFRAQGSNRSRHGTGVHRAWQGAHRAVRRPGSRDATSPFVPPSAG